jgi:hypothetical protein
MVFCGQNIGSQLSASAYAFDPNQDRSVLSDSYCLQHSAIAAPVFGSTDAAGDYAVEIDC